MRKKPVSGTGAGAVASIRKGDGTCWAGSAEYKPKRKEKMPAKSQVFIVFFQNKNVELRCGFAVRKPCREKEVGRLEELRPAPLDSAPRNKLKRAENCKCRMSAKVPQTLRQASNTEKLRRRTIVELAIGFMRQKEKDVGN